MKKNSQVLKRIVLIAAISLFTGLVWVALDSYRALIDRQEVEEVEHLLQPIDPQIDTTILDDLESRSGYSVEEIDEVLEAGEPTTAPEATSEGETNG